jgi:hypothetical protein
LPASLPVVGRALLPPELLGDRVVGLAVIEGDGAFRVIGDYVVCETVPRGVDAAVDVLRGAGAADPTAVPAARAVLWINHDQCTL